MDLEEGMLRKIAVSVVAVGLFVLAVIYIGTNFNDGGLGSTGGLALVVAVAVFILLMGVVGVFLDQD